MSQKKVISGSNIPQSHLPFSPGIIAGDYLFVSGQASVDDQGNIVKDTFAGECRRSFDNLKRIVEAAGASLADAVQVRNYVGRQEDLAEFNAIYREYFSAPYPARTTLIGCLGDLLKFEVDIVVYTGKK
ncbi:RidA family protein [Chitinophaga sp.]|uniref:RidA family protein n=1 Tax=Chitinophaga sp. TaxID=1869181 RepID=UPI0031DEEC3D